jgi:Asp/Glu/hydantoin racemase
VFPGRYTGQSLAYATAAKRLRKLEFGVPVIDGVAAATVMAESLIR